METRQPYEWETHKRYAKWLGSTKGETGGLVSYWREWLRVNDIVQRQRPSWEQWSLAHLEGER